MPKVFLAYLLIACAIPVLLYAYNSHPARITLISTARQPASTGVYIVTGLLGPRPEDFLPYAERFATDTDIYALNYSAWLPTLISSQLSHHIDHTNYQRIKLVNVSIGARIDVNAPGKKLEYYLVNPCNDPAFTKPYIRWGIRALTILLAVVAVLAIIRRWQIIIGTLAVVTALSTIMPLRIFSVPHKPAEIIQEVFDIGWRSRNTDKLTTSPVFVSTEDEFLDNIAIRQTSTPELTYTVHSAHAQLLPQMAAYLPAFKQAGLFS